MKQIKQCCKTCVFAQWEKTATGRIMRNVSGRCGYEIVIPVLPECASRFGGFRKDGICQDEGTTCKVWEPIR